MNSRFYNSTTFLSNIWHQYKYVFLLFILLISLNTSLTAQEISEFKNPKLEELILKNDIKNALEKIESEFKNLNLLSIEQQAYYWNKKSQIELQSGKFLESLNSGKNAEKILKSDSKSLQNGSTFRSICYAYIKLGKLDSALTYAEKLNNFGKINNDLKFQRSAQVALGNISLQNKAYSKSLNYYLEALQNTEKLNDTLNLKGDFYNVGLAYGRLGDIEKSNDFIFKAAKLAEKESTFDLLARCYGSISDNYLSLKNYEKQEEFLQKANEIAKRIGNRQLLAMGYANLMESQIFKGEYLKSVETGNKAILELKELPMIQLQAKVDSMLYISFKNLGDYKRALDQLEIYDETRLKIRNEKQKEKLDKLTIEFEVERKNLLIQSQAINLDREKTKNKLLISGIAIISLILIFIAYIQFKNSKIRRILFKKEKEITFQFSQINQLENIDANEINLALNQESDEGLDHKKLFSDILKFLQTKKLYLDPKFNQQSLVSEFGTNRQYLYEAISKNGEENFRGMVNRFRINDAKDLIDYQLENGAAIDFASLSEKVGFNSYPTFYRSFKNLTGLTPNEFMKELRKDKK